MLLTYSGLLEPASSGLQELINIQLELKIGNSGNIYIMANITHQAFLFLFLFLFFLERQFISIPLVVLGIIQGSGDKIMNKMNKSTCLHGVCRLMVRDGQ